MLDGMIFDVSMMDACVSDSSVLYGKNIEKRTKIVEKFANMQKNV